MEAFDGTPGVLLVSVRSYVNACCYLISIIHEPCAAVFAAMKIQHQCWVIGLFQCCDHQSCLVASVRIVAPLVLSPCSVLMLS